MSEKNEKKMEERAEVSFTFLVQTFIKFLLHTELQRETDIDDKGGERKTGEGAGGLGGALVTFSLWLGRMQDTHSRTSQSWDLSGLSLWGAL